MNSMSDETTDTHQTSTAIHVKSMQLTGVFRCACLDATAARDSTSFRAGATLCSEAAAVVTMCGSKRDSMQSIACTSQPEIQQKKC